MMFDLHTLQALTVKCVKLKELSNYDEIKQKVMELLD